MKLEESLINKIIEQDEVEGKWSKYLKNTISVYDIDAYIKKECGDQYQTFDYPGGAAIFTEREGSGKCIIVDHEAVGITLDSENDEFNLGLNNIPEQEVDEEGNIHRNIPIFPEYTIKTTIKEILTNGKATPTDFATFFDRRNYNSRCQENFDELMSSLSSLGILKGTTEDSEVYEESKQKREIKGIYNIASDLSVYVYSINYGIEDEVEWAFSNNKDDIHKSVIDYDYEDEYGPLAEAQPFFMADNIKVYLNEVMRTDLTESVEKLEEDETATLDTKVKEWMLKNYPEEEDFIVDMPEDLTFRDVHERMLKHEDIYEIIQTNDSTDREDVFNGLCEATGYDYDYFYYLWLYGPEDERYLKYKKESKEIKEEAKTKWKSYVKRWARDDWEAGQPFSSEDFEQFKQMMKDDNFELPDNEFEDAWNYYWECYNDALENASY